MLKKIVLISTLLAIHFSLKAQEETLNSGFGIGYQLVQYQSDFGFGLNVVSPYFANNHLGVRLKANLMYNQNVIDGLSDWIPYTNVSLGVIGVAGKVSERIRLYGEGGFIVLLPSSAFSSADFVPGGYGLFGFEFFFNKGGNYFIEIGGVGTGASAEKIDTQPIYSNGLSISTGIRFFWQ